MVDTINILLVEDDEDDYIITRDYLADNEQSDYQLAWVNNGADALARLRADTCPYDVCLLDYRLGEMTGFDILRTVIAEKIYVPIVLLTEHSDNELDFLAMQEGAYDFLVKSEINGRALDRSIRYVCAAKKHEHERLALALALEASRQAEDTIKSKDEFLGVVSHEMRGPINSMLLWIDILKSPDTEPEMRENGIDTLERSIRQQSHILNNLIEFTRGFNQTISLNVHSIDILGLLKDLINSYRLLAKEKSIDLTLSPASGQLWLQADPDRVQQILNNLVANAIKFTPEGGRIGVTVSQQLIENKDFVEVVVRDNGMGINPDLLPYVFNRYQQAPTKSYSRNTGLGLGLAIARQLIELHGGNIHAESPGEDQGSAFFVKLPIR